MTPPTFRAGAFDTSRFLAEYWQKKPLLIRNPWTDWRNPLPANELAGLACEEDVEARLVIGGVDGPTVEHGPLDEHRFDKIGTKDWTLLVQAVDQFDPDVAALIEPFRFIPDWRIDDVMVSFAADGGGVGAHYDAYDVFLVQGQGRRRWRIGGMCDADTPLAPHDDLRLLARFDAVEEYVLGAGDILYVPPGIAHEGTAIGGSADDGCMTYSIGFRAPSDLEMLADYTDQIVAASHDEARYADPGLQMQDNPGEITAATIDRLHAMVLDRLRDRTAFERWLGENLSTGKYGGPSQPDAEVLPPGTPLCRNGASRFAYVERGTDAVTLFVDGQAYDCSDAEAGFARKLCAAPRGDLDADLVEDPDGARLITRLFAAGALVPADELI